MKYQLPICDKNKFVKIAKKSKYLDTLGLKMFGPGDLFMK